MVKISRFTCARCLPKWRLINPPNAHSLASKNVSRIVCLRRHNDVMRSCRPNLFLFFYSHFSTEIHAFCIRNAMVINLIYRLLYKIAAFIVVCVYFFVSHFFGNDGRDFCVFSKSHFPSFFCFVREFVTPTINKTKIETKQKKYENRTASRAWRRARLLCVLRNAW